MRNKPSACPTRSILTTICIWCCLLCTTTAAPNPQNFLNEAAAGALGAASQVAELFQNGFAARRDFVFQMPGFGMHSKSDIGMGEAILRRTQSDEEDSAEDGRGRRRRRAIESEEYGAIAPKISFKKLLRNMHAPCHSGGSGTGGTGGTGGDTDTGDGEEIIEEARRRMARMKARKAALAKKAKNAKSKKSKGRRKRQTEFEDLSESEVEAWRDRLREHYQQFAEKMNRFYENVYAAMMDKMKRLMGANVEGED